MSTSSSSGNSSFTSSSSGTSSFTSSSYEDSSFSLSSSSIPQFSLKEINIATNNFNEDRILGKGGEAIVYKAELYLTSKTEKTWVAVKRLNKDSTVFEKEIQIVSKIQHQYVVALHGYCNDSGEKIMIYEYMKNGSLSDYVKKDCKICLTWKQRLNICLGAAYGLQHLHKKTTDFSKGIIHRDVKPANILLNEDWVAKVSDFGMFKLSDSAQIQSTMNTGFPKGTAGYFAPEYCFNFIITRKADVYAFGVVLFEVLCRKKLWDRGDVSYYGSENEDVGVWARENVDVEIKNDISSDSLKAFTDVLGRCLQQNRKRRPTMDGVVQSLELAIKCQEGHSENLNTDLSLLRLEEELSDIEEEEEESSDTEEEVYMPQQTLSEPAITLEEEPSDAEIEEYMPQQASPDPAIMLTEELDISLIGLQNAGKTSLVNLVATSGYSEDMFQSTVGFNKREVIKGNVAITFWDVGGQPRFRIMWERYCRAVSVIVYVVDAADQDNLIISKGLFHDLLSKPSLNGIPLLLLGNKIDKPGALSEEEFIDQMDFKSITDREVRCFMISCKNSTNIDLVIDWLIKHSKPKN